MKMISVQTFLDAEDHTRFKIVCAKKKESIEAATRRLIVEYVAKEKRKEVV
jgi:plasmid stability protein